MPARETERLDIIKGDIWKRYTLHNQTQQQIAAHHGISQQRVSQLLTEIRAELPKETREEIVARRMAQIDAVLATMLPAARGGDTDANVAMLKLMDREAKYLGLDAAQRIDAAIATVDPADIEIVQRIRSWKNQDNAHE